jgi:AraC-like DNA-binding protein
MSCIRGQTFEQSQDRPTASVLCHLNALKAVHELARGEHSSVAALHPLSWRVLTIAIELAFRRPNVTMVAKLLSLSTRQLERRFKNAGLPAPQRLVVVGRWLPIAATLSLPSTPTAALARATGFASTQAFCRASQRELRISVRDLRSACITTRLMNEVITAYQRPITEALQRDRSAFGFVGGEL